MSKLFYAKGESYTPKVNFNTTFISIDTTLSCKQSVLALLTFCNLNEKMIKILVAELNEKHLNETKMLNEINEYEKVEDKAYYSVKNLGDPFQQKIYEII